jgi:hypothetical protein
VRRGRLRRLAEVAGDQRDAVGVRPLVDQRGQLGLARRADQQRDAVVVGAGEQQPGELAPDQSGRPGHQERRHRLLTSRRLALTLGILLHADVSDHHAET